MTSLVDTHCHIDLGAFEEDRQAVLQRMLSAGVSAAVLIAYNPERWVTSTELCEQHPFLVRAVGLHPNDASLWTANTLARLRSELSKGDAVAVGETGLDYFRDHADPALQREAFVAQIELAREWNLPLVIHQRGAEDDVLGVLRPYAPLRGIMHCFSGDAAFASECLNLGLDLGVGGVATFPKSGEIRDAVKNVPLDRIVIETDSPFLAPQAVRGQRNEPSNVRYVADCLAEIHGCTVEKVAMMTTATAVRLYGPRLDAAIRAGSECVQCV